MAKTTGTIIDIDIKDGIASLCFNRPEKRNAVNDRFVAELGDFFAQFPANKAGIKAVILSGAGGNFCSGLDLAEHTQRNATDTLTHSREWHRIMDAMEHSGVPVLSAMTGAVIGGGLEIATATHVRIAEPSVIFQLPEGKRGIFVGGGASVRVGRIIGADRLREMMLTGRKYNADEGLRLGLAHYTVGEGEALSHAMGLARKIAGNAAFSNYLMLHALSHINDMPSAGGLFAESMAAALAQTTPEAVEGLKAFLEKRDPDFG